MRLPGNIWAGSLLILLAGVFGACSETSTNAVPAVRNVETIKPKQTGIASYYAEKYHGKPTASGEIFDMHKLTAAHRTLPFGTKVTVTDASSQRSVVVRINDRGPFIAGRVIDLSLAAAKELQMVEAGLAEVRLEVIE